LGFSVKVLGQVSQFGPTLYKIVLFVMAAPPERLGTLYIAGTFTGLADLVRGRRGTAGPGPSVIAVYYMVGKVSMFSVWQAGMIPAGSNASNGKLQRSHLARVPSKLTVRVRAAGSGRGGEPWLSESGHGTNPRCGSATAAPWAARWTWSGRSTTGGASRTAGRPGSSSGGSRRGP
jgi:hypothetical protein